MQKTLEIAKAGYGPGPWQGEPDRVEFEAHGYPCLIRRVPVLGHFCGYVAVPPGHPWHGIEYGDLKPSPDAHGGVNSAGPCSGDICHRPKPGEPEDVWWLGFDCAHWNDVMPGVEGLKKEVLKASPFATSPLAASWSPTYKTLGFVRAEVEGLALQALEAKKNFTLWRRVWRLLARLVVSPHRRLREIFSKAALFIAAVALSGCMAGGATPCGVFVATDDVGVLLEVARLEAEFVALADRVAAPHDARFSDTCRALSGWSVDFVPEGLQNAQGEDIGGQTWVQIRLMVIEEKPTIQGGSLVHEFAHAVQLGEPRCDAGYDSMHACWDQHGVTYAVDEVRHPAPAPVVAP